MKVTGILQDIKSRQTSFGTMYDLVVDGSSYGNGKYAPRGVALGDTVSFDVEVKGNYKNVAARTLQKVAAQAQQEIAGAIGLQRNMPQRSAGSDGDRQAVISRQAALNTACSILEMALDNEAIALPAKPNERYAVLKTALFDLVNICHKFSTGSEVEVPDFGVEKRKPAAKKAGVKDTIEDSTDDDGYSDDDIPF